MLLVLVMVFCYNDYIFWQELYRYNFRKKHTICCLPLEEHKIMDNVNMILVDYNNYFLAINDKYNVKIDYKLYSMMAGSIDYQKIGEVINGGFFQDVVERIAFLRYKIEDCERRGVPRKEMNKYYGEFYHDVSLLYEPVCSLVDTGHLDGQQLSLVMELFMHELAMHFKSVYFKRHDARNYIPSILSNRGLKNYINSTLMDNGLNTLPLLKVKEELEHTLIKMTFTTIDGIPRVVYNIRHTLDFLLVDLHKPLPGKKKIKKCLCCGRLFFSSYGAKYCKLPHKDTGKTCDYIMHHRPKDRLEAVFANAKRSQAKKRDDDKNIDKYGDTFMQYIYNKWLEECKVQHSKAVYENDTEGFQDWVRKTKFLKERLVFLYEEYKAEADKAHGMDNGL